ncbi:MAG: ribose 5-phosphate isomerase B [Myxococcota bacterium]
MKVAAGSDHGGFALKRELCAALRAAGHEVADLGSHDETSVDYPDYARAVARAVARGEADRGLLCCGSGIGMAIAANKVAGVRAAVVSDPYSARMSRAHNDANVLCLGGRVVGGELAKDCLRAFLETPFEGGRHARRVAKLDEPDGER